MRSAQDSPALCHPAPGEAARLHSYARTGKRKKEARRDTIGNHASDADDGRGAALAGMSVLRIVGPTYAFQTPATGEVVPWLDQLEENPVPEVIVQQLDWEDLDTDAW